jgi:hypothetical protein
VEATETEPAETVPETTVPETTVPETLPETQPVTVATEAAEETLEETVPVMTEPEWLHETQPEPEEEPERNRNGLWFGLFLITGTLSLVLLGALVFRRRSY